MLLAIHEQPVASLEDDGILDLDIARHTLKEVSRSLQAAGWHFNTVRGARLFPAVPSKMILLPHNCLRVDTVRQDAHINVVQRGDRLFNVSANSFKFDNPVLVDMVLFLPIDEIIQPARDYIAIKATRRFQARVLGSQAVEYFTAQEEFQAKAVLEGVEVENLDCNYLHDNPLSWYTLSRDRSL